MCKDPCGLLILLYCLSQISIIGYWRISKCKVCYSGASGELAFQSHGKGVAWKWTTMLEKLEPRKGEKGQHIIHCLRLIQFHMKPDITLEFLGKLTGLKLGKFLYVWTSMNEISVTWKKSIYIYIYSLFLRVPYHAL